jgi:hypothetical protein
MLQKILETSRILYWFGIASKNKFISAMFSIYPPFYFGVHSAVLSWLTLVVVLAMHVACIIDKQIK